MYRRRRRPKYTWFPTAGTVVPAVGNQQEFVQSPTTIQMAVGGNVNIAHTVFPLVPPDTPREESDELQVLNDVVGNEYKVERIVGNFFGTVYGEAAVAGVPPAIMLAFGIFVARADGTTPTEPAGAQGSVDESSRNFNPLDNQTIREPWMFRRTWVLGTRGDNANGNILGTDVVTTQGRAWGNFPATTAGYSGIRQGPHFDVKSKRRIRQDDRLWGVVAACSAPILWPQGEGGGYRVEAIIDYRVLAGLRRAKNRSNF